MRKLEAYPILIMGLLALLAGLFLLASRVEMYEDGSLVVLGHSICLPGFPCDESIEFDGNVCSVVYIKGNRIVSIVECEE